MRKADERLPEPARQIDREARRRPDREKHGHARRDRLLDELDSWRAALGFPAIGGEREYGEVPELDPEARERLRALGYVE